MNINAKELCQVLGAHARAGVLHGDALTAVGQLGTDHHLAPPRREFDRIGEQVADHRGGHVFVRPRCRLRPDSGLQPHALALRCRLLQSGDAVAQLRKRDPRRPHLELSRLGERPLEDAFKELRALASSIVKVGAHLPYPPCVKMVVAADKNLAEGKEPADGIAKIMGQNGEKLVLGKIRLDQLALALPQPCGGALQLINENKAAAHLRGKKSLIRKGERANLQQVADQVFIAVGTDIQGEDELA